MGYSIPEMGAFTDWMTGWGQAKVNLD